MELSKIQDAVESVTLLSLNKSYSTSVRRASAASASFPTPHLKPEVIVMDSDHKW